MHPRSLERRARLVDLRQVASSSLAPAMTTIVQNADATSSTTPENVATLPPSSVKALAGIITVLSLIILGTAAWKYRSWVRKRRARLAGSSRGISFKKESLFGEQSFDLEAASADTEKPSKAVVPSAVPTTPAVISTWVPQFKPFRANPDAIHAFPEPARRSKRSTKSFRISVKGRIEKTISKYAGSPRSPGPPPVYSSPVPPLVPPMAPLQIARTNLPPSLPKSDPAPVPESDTRTSKAKSRSKKLEIVPQPFQNEVVVDSPMRSASIPTQSFAIPIPVPRTDFSTGGKRLPRLVSVTATFVPTLSDELAIKVGDTIRLLDEYEDQWCLVEHVGRFDVQRGVVPRLCLQERAEIIKAPATPYRRLPHTASKSSF